MIHLELDDTPAKTESDCERQRLQYRGAGEAIRGTLDAMYPYLQAYEDKHIGDDDEVVHDIAEYNEALRLECSEKEYTEQELEAREQEREKTFLAQYGGVITKPMPRDAIRSIMRLIG